MKINKFSLVKYLILLVVILWSFPVLAEEIPTDTSTPLTSEIETTSTPPNTTTPAVASSAVIIRYQDQIIWSGSVDLTSTVYRDSINNIDYPLNSNNVFSALVLADQQSDSFNISDAQFNSGFNSFYLACIKITSGDNACYNWNYIVNNAYPSTSMDSYNLVGGETIYIYFSNPWQITASTTTFPVDTTTTFQTWRYQFDNLLEPWILNGNNLIDISIPNPTPTGWWDQTITVTTTETNANGTADFVFNTTGTYFAKITSLDFSKWSNPITVTVHDAVATTTDPNTSTDSQPFVSGGGGSGFPTNELISQQKINDTVNKLLSFIKSKQESDGKIIDIGTSDWLAMSFGAKNIYAADVKNGTASLYDYLYNYDTVLLDQELNNCTAYPRHILALLASGVAKTDTRINTLKIKLDGCVQNNNFGLPGINDDIFGLLAALAIGEGQNSPVVQNTVATIRANQETDGGFAYPGPFESPDLTGAALSALKYAQNNGMTIEADIFSKAKQYLKNQQLADGGWGFGASDALTTGWAVMGINALGEDQTAWFNSNHKNPWYILTTLDNDHYTQSWDGGIDWFGTKHAVPALLGKSWPIILAPLATAQNTADSGSLGGSGASSTSTEITSIITPTSTPTTTPIIITLVTSTTDHATTTGEVLGEKIIRTQIIKPTISKQKKIIAKNTLPLVKSELAQTTRIEPEKTNPTVLPVIKQAASANRDTVKIILAVSGSGALLIAIYLGLKSLKK
jgi:hypothetical protein